MHLSPHLSPQRTLVVQLFQSVFLDGLGLIQVDVVLWALYCFPLCEFCVLEVVNLHGFSFLPRMVIEVIDTMAEVAFLSFQVAEPSHVEPAKRSLWW
jgi:hypothetical protein